MIAIDNAFVFAAGHRQKPRFGDIGDIGCGEQQQASQGQKRNLFVDHRQFQPARTRPLSTYGEAVAQFGVEK